jgi:hypothetical protein
MRHLLTVLGALLLAGCGGKEEAPAAEKDADPARSAAEAITAGASTPLTLDDAERAGFVRGRANDYADFGASDGASGTLEGDNVEVYVFDGAPPAGQFQALMGGEEEWAGVCEVGNLAMLYHDPSACQVLRAAER